MSHLKEQGESLSAAKCSFAAFVCDGCNTEIVATLIDVPLLSFFKTNN